MKRPPPDAAFSLVEVVLALGIMSFALIAIFGLFTVGLKTSSESSDQIQAANLASLLLSVRRGMPTNAIADFALPPLNLSMGTAGTVIVGTDGTTRLAGALPGPDRYKLKYVIKPSPVSTNAANVYLLLWWPSTAATPPTNSPGGYYEMSTQIALP